MKYLMQILHDEVVTFEDQQAAEMEGGNKETKGAKKAETNEEEELLKNLEAEMNKLNEQLDDDNLDFDALMAQTNQILQDNDKAIDNREKEIAARKAEEKKQEEERIAKEKKRE